MKLKRSLESSTNKSNSLPPITLSVVDLPLTLNPSLSELLSRTTLNHTSL